MMSSGATSDPLSPAQFSSSSSMSSPQQQPQSASPFSPLFASTGTNHPGLPPPQQPWFSSSSSSNWGGPSSETTATGNINIVNKPLTPKSVDAALAPYERFQVADNWLNEDLLEYMAQAQTTTTGSPNEQDASFYQGVPPLGQQLDEWEQQADKEEDGR